MRSWTRHGGAGRCGWWGTLRTASRGPLPPPLPDDARLKVSRFIRPLAPPHPATVLPTVPPTLASTPRSSPCSLHAPPPAPSLPPVLPTRLTAFAGRIYLSGGMPCAPKVWGAWGATRQRGRADAHLHGRRAPRGEQVEVSAVDFGSVSQGAASAGAELRARPRPSEFAPRPPVHPWRRQRATCKVTRNRRSLAVVCLPRLAQRGLRRSCVARLRAMHSRVRRRTGASSRPHRPPPGV